MARAARRALAALAAALLGIAAAAGLAATAAFLFLASPQGRSLLAARVVAAIDGAIAGSIRVESVSFGRGGVELGGVRVLDPDGEVVIAAARAHAAADLTRLRGRRVGVELELDGPEVVLATGEDGRLGIARAFAPARPAGDREREASPRGEGPPSPWSVDVTRLAIRDGAVRWLDAAGEPRLDLAGLDLDAAGGHGPGGTRLALRGTAAMRAPVEAPVDLDGAASLRDGELRVSGLRARVGATAVDLVGEWDFAARRGRAALTSFEASREALRALVPRAPPGSDVAGAAYAEADGEVATVAAELRPRDGGRADAAAAVRLRAPLAAGVDLVAERLDPSRVASVAPPGELTFTARGRIRGTDPRRLTAALSLRASPSRLRGAAFGPVEVEAGAAGGAFEVRRLAATLPGARFEGRARWTVAGAVGGAAKAEAGDLAAAGAAVGRLLAIRLPPLDGAASLAAEASGTTAAPRLAVRLQAPRLAVGGARAAGVSVEGEVAGPLRTPRLRAAASAASVAAAGREATSVALEASVEGRDARATVRARVEEFGVDPVTVGARGTFDEARRVLALEDGWLSWPGTRLALARPARIDLAGPRVDRLELAGDGPRVRLEGGLGVERVRRRAVRTVDARAALERFDLARLPRGLVPERLRLAGVVSIDASARGPLSGPAAEARVHLEGGAAYGVDGLAVDAAGSFDGGSRRAVVEGTVRRAAGGELELRAEVPAALLAARASEPLSLRASLRSIPLHDALRAGGSAAPLAGIGDLDVALTGRVGAPVVAARAALREARWADWGTFTARADLQAPGDAVHLEASLDWDGARALAAEARVPVDVARLLREPATAARALPDAALAGKVALGNLDLRRLAGRLGLPDDLTGVLSGDGTIAGTLRAPRGELGLDATHLAMAGYAGGEAHVVLALGSGVTAVAGRAALSGQELLAFEGTVFAGPEVIASDLDAAEHAPFDLDVRIPGADLGGVGGEVPLAGTVRGRATVSGSLAAPRLELTLQGDALAVEGRPLGRLEAAARSAGARLEAQARLTVPTGGVLTADLLAQSGLGVAALRDGALARAPASARLVADRVDLAVLPALLPGTVRSAAGLLGADVAAEGPLASMRPRGTLRVTGGKVAVSEMGEWEGIEVDASVTDDAVRLERLEVRRGRSGKLEARAQATGLSGSGAAPFEAHVRAEDLDLPRGGQVFATIDDLVADAKGTVDPQALRARIDVKEGARIVLPNQSPRELQSLSYRDDIVIGAPKKRRPRRAEGEAGEGSPYRFVLQVSAPRVEVDRFDPRIDVDVAARDVELDFIEGRTYAAGEIDVLRGELEPVGGRRFEIEKGRLTFTGGGPADAVISAVARYDNPDARVTVTVSGPISKPDVKMTSEPAMDESQIALLIATGRTDFKPGAGGVDTLTGEEAGKTAAGLGVTLLARDVLAQKLPLDTFAFDPTGARLGWYVGEKVYVGYTRNFEAVPERGENVNEVRIEYQISRRWTFEARGGDAQSGGASLIWSKDY
jgi:translocation and assembly module TamB